MNEKGKKKEDENITFESMGLNEVLCEACRRLKWHQPSDIQKEAIPVALQGRDVIGLAETGSGKTAAFALPIMHHLLEHRGRFFCLVLTPTRELALQICEQFDELGRTVQLKTAVLIGGMDMEDQATILAKRPHILIATPGRLLDHLKNTKGFNLDKLQYLVLDEADKILNMDFEVAVNKILTLIPKNRTTFLFSATMTQKVAELERACLKDPVKLEVSLSNQTVQKLIQFHLFIPLKYKEMYLSHLLNTLSGNSCIIFCGTVRTTEIVSRMLFHLHQPTLMLHGQMSQRQRFQSLKRFRDKERSILVATDVAARGLDIPHVDAVLIYDLPNQPKDYIHRVGRTARAGKAGRSFTFVTQNDVHQYLKIEAMLGFKIDKMELDLNAVLPLKEAVAEAREMGKRQIVEIEKKKKRQKKEGRNKRKRDDGRNHDDDDDDNDDEDEYASDNDAADDDDRSGKKIKKDLKKNNRKKKRMFEL